MSTLASVALRPLPLIYRRGMSNWHFINWPEVGRFQPANPLQL